MPGAEPKVVEESFNDWRDTEWPRIFPRDFESVAFFQKGMKSRGFTVGRSNPIAESTVDNFHHHIRQMVLGA